MTYGPIFFCCDEGYAVPLATALRSLSDANVQNWPLDIRILVPDAPGPWRHKVEASLPRGAANVLWHQIETDAFRKFPTMQHVSASTFGRLLIEQFVTAQNDRVLYLDADIVVLGSLDALWRADLGDCTLGAVRDDFDNELKFLRTPSAQAKAAPRVADYFNAGVLLIDMPRWRARNVAQTALDYLQRSPNTPYADQDALNVACDRQWKELGTHWNSIDAVEQINLAKTPVELRPAIVHFAAWRKPWNFAYPNQNAKFYDKLRDRTVFRRTFLERWLDWARRVWGPSRRTVPIWSRAITSTLLALFSPTKGVG